MENLLTIKSFERNGSYITLYYNRRNMRFGLKSDFGCEQVESPMFETVDNCFNYYLERYLALESLTH